jgi:hypothetical protein
MTNKSVIANVPKNVSLLQPTKFSFVIPEMQNLVYFVQNINLPGVSTSEVPVETPFSSTYRHGDKLVYETLNITFLIDEDLKAWEETLNWLTSLTFPKDYRQYGRIQGQKKRLYYDAILTINTNANLPNLRIKFFDCHPITLSEIAFSTTDSAENNMIADVTFRYDRYEIERLNT